MTGTRANGKKFDSHRGGGQCEFVGKPDDLP